MAKIGVLPERSSPGARARERTSVNTPNSSPGVSRCARAPRTRGHTLARRHIASRRGPYLVTGMHPRGESYSQITPPKESGTGFGVRKTRGYAPLGGAHGLGLGDRGEGHGGGDGRHLELSCGYVKSAGVCDDGGRTRSIAELRTNSQSWASLSSLSSTNHDAAFHPLDFQVQLEVRVRFRIEIFRIVES